VETPALKVPSAKAQRTKNGLRKGSVSFDQKSMLLPISGGQTVSHAEAARAAAERRWYAQVHSLGENAEADVLSWMTEDRQEAATQAEMRRRGGGIDFIVTAMRGDRLRVMH
jgi:hypothetical protein